MFFKKRMLQLCVVISLSLISLAFTTNTYAASNQNFSRNVSYSVKPHRVYCDAEWVYNNLTRFNDKFVPVAPTQSVYNGTGSNGSATFSATHTGTVSVTINAGVKVSVSTVIIGVEASFGISVTASISTTLGNAATFSVPPHRTLNGQYGVWEVYTVGHYYYINNACKDQIDGGYIDVYTPYKVGWSVWIS